MSDGKISANGAYYGRYGRGGFLFPFRGILKTLESQRLGLIDAKNTYSQMVAALNHKIDDVRVLGSLNILAVDFEQSVILAQAS